MSESSRFRVGIKLSIPGTLFSIEAPEMIEMQMQGVTRLDEKTQKVEFRAINGVSHLIIEGTNEDFNNLVELLNIKKKARV